MYPLDCGRCTTGTKVLGSTVFWPGWRLAWQDHGIYTGGMD